MSNMLFIACILIASLYFAMGLQELNQCISGRMLSPKMNSVAVSAGGRGVCCTHWQLAVTLGY